MAQKGKLLTIVWFLLRACVDRKAPVFDEATGRLVCDGCQRHFETFTALAGHKRFCDGGNWHCEWCHCPGEKAQSKTSGPNGPKTLCASCGARYRSGHSRPPPMDSKGRVFCKNCNKRFDTIGGLGSHRRFCNDLLNLTVEDLDLGGGTAALPDRPATSLPGDVAGDVLQIWDVCIFLGSCILDLPAVEWNKLEAAFLADPNDVVGAHLVHSLHCHLVKFLIEYPVHARFDLGDKPLHNRPINMHTWPEMLRKYLHAYTKHYQPNEHATVSADDMGEFVDVLASTEYSNMSLRQRARMLRLITDVALDTTVVREHLEAVNTTLTKIRALKRDRYDERRKQIHDEFEQRAEKQKQENALKQAREAAAKESAALEAKQRMEMQLVGAGAFPGTFLAGAEGTMMPPDFLRPAKVAHIGSIDGSTAAKVAPKDGPKKTGKPDDVLVVAPRKVAERSSSRLASTTSDDGPRPERASSSGSNADTAGDAGGKAGLTAAQSNHKAFTNKRQAEADARREIDKEFQTEVDAVGEKRRVAFGKDRNYNTYWVIGNDYSRILVQKIVAETGSEQWVAIETWEEVVALLASLHIRGMRESVLLESLKKHEPKLKPAMEAKQVEEKISVYHKKKAAAAMAKEARDACRTIAASFLEEDQGAVESRCPYCQEVLTEDDQHCAYCHTTMSKSEVSAKKFATHVCACADARTGEEITLHPAILQMKAALQDIDAAVSPHLFKARWGHTERVQWTEQVKLATTVHELEERILEFAAQLEEENLLPVWRSWPEFRKYKAGERWSDALRAFGIEGVLALAAEAQSDVEVPIKTFGTTRRGPIVHEVAKATIRLEQMEMARPQLASVGSVAVDSTPSADCLATDAGSVAISRNASGVLIAEADVPVDTGYARPASAMQPHATDTRVGQMYAQPPRRQDTGHSYVPSNGSSSPTSQREGSASGVDEPQERLAVKAGGGLAEYGGGKPRQTHSTTIPPFYTPGANVDTAQIAMSTASAPPMPKNPAATVLASTTAAPTGIRAGIRVVPTGIRAGFVADSREPPRDGSAASARMDTALATTPAWPGIKEERAMDTTVRPHAFSSVLPAAGVGYATAAAAGFIAHSTMPPPRNDSLEAPGLEGTALNMQDQALGSGIIKPEPEEGTFPSPSPKKEKLLLPFWDPEPKPFKYLPHFRWPAWRPKPKQVAARGLLWIYCVDEVTFTLLSFQFI